MGLSTPLFSLYHPLSNPLLLHFLTLSHLSRNSPLSLFPRPSFAPLFPTLLSFHLPSHPPLLLLLSCSSPFSSSHLTPSNNNRNPSAPFSLQTNPLPLHQQSVQPRKTLRTSRRGHLLYLFRQPLSRPLFRKIGEDGGR